MNNNLNSEKSGIPFHLFCLTLWLRGWHTYGPLVFIWLFISVWGFSRTHEQSWPSGQVLDWHSIEGVRYFLMTIFNFFRKESYSNVTQLVRRSIKWRFETYNSGPKVCHSRRDLFRSKRSLINIVALETYLFSIDFR